MPKVVAHKIKKPENKLVVCVVKTLYILCIIVFF